MARAGATVSNPAADLAELLEPLRDQAVGSLLEAMADALETGGAVVQEPELRDDAGKVLRRIDGGPAPEGESLVARTSDGFEAEIHAFRWDAAELTLLSR